MAIPNHATGYGNENAANVFRISFSQDCSQAAKYEMYDRSAAWVIWRRSILVELQRCRFRVRERSEVGEQDRLGSHC